MSDRTTTPSRTVVCNYCGNPAVLQLSSEHLYHGRDYGPVWECKPCDAWVGVHKDSRDHAPLGRLANKELRIAKQAAHRAFDRLWEGKMRRDGVSQNKARGAAYKWLAEQMQMPAELCHVGMMTVEQCRQVVRICSSIGSKKEASE